MMSRITLHLKRFAHTSTTIDSLDTRWNLTRRRSAHHHHVPHGGRIHEVSTLRAAQPGHGWSTVLDSESGEGGSESFALESRVVAQPFAEASALGTLREVGDEEVVGV